MCPHFVLQKGHSNERVREYTPIKLLRGRACGRIGLSCYQIIWRNISSTWVDLSCCITHPPPFPPRPSYPPIPRYTASFWQLDLSTISLIQTKYTHQVLFSFTPRSRPPTLSPFLPPWTSPSTLWLKYIYKNWFGKANFRTARAQWSATQPDQYRPSANNESSEVVDILVPATFSLNPLTWLDNAKSFWRFVFCRPSSLLYAVAYYIERVWQTSEECRWANVDSKKSH